MLIHPSLREIAMKPIRHFALTLLLAVAMLGGCAGASKRAGPDALAPLDPKVLGATQASEALEALAHKKKRGENNMIFALSFAEAPPKELLTSWSTLESAF